MIIKYISYVLDKMRIERMLNDKKIKKKKKKHKKKEK